MSRRGKIVLSLIWLACILGAFVGGFMFCLSHWRFSPAIMSEEMFVIVCPRPSGPIYSVDDFINANTKLETFLKSKAGDYDGLDPHIYLLPTHSGYNTISTSGKAGVEIPKELWESAKAISTEALGVPYDEPASE